MQQHLSAKLSAKLHHLLCKELHKHAKKARGFETQKLVKRLRFLRKKAELSHDVPDHIKEARKKDITRLEIDLVAFKAINLYTCIKNSVTDAIKNSTMAQKQMVLTAVDAVQEADKNHDNDGNEIKQDEDDDDKISSHSIDISPTVLERLSKRLAGSKEMKLGLSQAVAELVRAFGNEVTGQEGEWVSTEGGIVVKKRKAVETEVKSDSKRAKKASTTETLPLSGKRESVGVQDKLSVHSAVPPSITTEYNEKDGEKEEEEDEYAVDDAFSLDGDSDSDDDDMFLDRLDAGNNDNVDGDLSEISVSDYDDGETSPRSSVSAPKKMADKSKSSKKLQQRKQKKMEEKLDEDGLPIRKNRMGQRARRLLAEKKYGRDARHFQLELVKKKAPARPGGVSGSASNGRQPAAEESLHPSWQAKRLVKASIGGFSGTKVLFGDTDDAGRVEKKELKQQKTHQPRQQNQKEKEDLSNLHPSWQAKKRQSELMAKGGTFPL